MCSKTHCECKTSIVGNLFVTLGALNKFHITKSKIFKNGSQTNTGLKVHSDNIKNTFYL